MRWDRNIDSKVKGLLRLIYSWNEKRIYAIIDSADQNAVNSFPILRMPTFVKNSQGTKRNYTNKIDISLVKLKEMATIIRVL